MGRAPCCEDKEGLKKGAWTAEEDEKLVSFIKKNKGHGSWRTLPKLAGLERCGKSCRLRWTNYLRPNIKRGNFTPEEEHVIIQLHALMGNKWSNIASHLPERTDNEVKNHWNTHLKKRLAKMGIDPTTHLPLQELIYNPHHQDVVNYYRHLSTQMYYNENDDWRRALLQRYLQLDPAMASQLVQWEQARLEAEARVKLAAASSHEYMQNYALWRQSCAATTMSLQQQNQPASIYNFNDLMSLQQNQPSSIHSQSAEPLQSSCEDGVDHFLQNGEPCPNLFSSPSSLHVSEAGDLPQLHQFCKGPVHTSTTNIATPETCSSDTISQLNIVADQLQFPADEDVGLITSVADITSSSLNDHTSLHDSYWNKMLNLLGHASFESF